MSNETGWVQINQSEFSSLALDAEFVWVAYGETSHFYFEKEGLELQLTETISGEKSYWFSRGQPFLREKDLACGSCGWQGSETRAEKLAKPLSGDKAHIVARCPECGSGCRQELNEINSLIETGRGADSLSWWRDLLFANTVKSPG